MRPLEKLFLLEVEFYRRLRTVAPGTPDSSGVHTSYALQCGYEPIIREVGSATGHDIEQLRHRLLRADDARDILAARDSIERLLMIARPGG
jgi:hypothetical protein